MHSVASNLDESTGFFHEHGALLTRIEQATEALEQRIIAAARVAEATAAQPQVIAPPVSVAPAVAAPPASFPQVAAVAESVATDFDPDIASIFTDEAVELIDQAQSALAQWNENRSSVDGLTALKRPLHTLKGGARMAGLMPMGDLSHELETLFMQIDGGVVAADDRAFSLAQSSLDELARMRESVTSGKGCPTANGLIAKIHALVAGTPPAAAAPAPTPSPSPPPPPPVAVAPASAGSGASPGTRGGSLTATTAAPGRRCCACSGGRCGIRAGHRCRTRSGGRCGPCVHCRRRPETRSGAQHFGGAEPAKTRIRAAAATRRTGARAAGAGRRVGAVSGSVRPS